ncbi:MAG TPA: 50S ribosomal protein L29 [Planctomycetota bacterium]|jgi:large subunit ribosomal protein L29|nr:50S ribosomal protein L29 [Planctomycetota bacterium]
MSAKERIKEILALPTTELEAEITKNREKMFKLRFHGKGKDMQNPRELKSLRKDIARMLTVIRQRQPQPSAGGRA